MNHPPHPPRSAATSPSGGEVRRAGFLTSPPEGEVDSRSESGGGDDSLYRCGSTYSWEPFDGIPTAAGRAELEGKLREFLRLPFVVVDHRAAVRPIIRESRPHIERRGRLGFFNGLGSKGALLSPHFAARFVEELL